MKRLPFTRKDQAQVPSLIAVFFLLGVELRAFAAVPSEGIVNWGSPLLK